MSKAQYSQKLLPLTLLNHSGYYTTYVLPVLTSKRKLYIQSKGSIYSFLWFSK